jgi:DNA-binding PadR family transcriptional regulator
MHRRIVKNFLDVLILMELLDNPLSGYDVISFIHKHFNVLLSSGTVYSCLYFLEREGLIRSEWIRRKRVYKLTEKGKQTVRTLLKMKANS